MPSHNDSIWGNVNTCFEIGLEIAKLMEKNGESKGVSGDSKAEKITDGVLLMSDNKDIVLAVSKETAEKGLSETARSYGKEKGDNLCYAGDMTAIPLYELSQQNENVRDYIVSEESLRATLCGNYPEYVKSHNMAAPESQIKDADAPLYMFLQKQLDLAADSTHAEVAEYQVAHAHETATENGLTDDVLEMER